MLEHLSSVQTTRILQHCPTAISPSLLLTRRPPRMVASTRRLRDSKPTFRDSAPSNTIPFPKMANMTVVEILAFLPNSINCPDVIYRMISNGGSRKSIHAMINTHRAFETEWSANCCGEAMYKTMEKAGYVNWTITRHDRWHDDQQRALWDGKKLAVSELRVTRGASAEGISFSRLASNMRVLPEGDDALDLTRMVRYCVEEAEDGWTYPTDYEELLELIGGPAPVRDENTDSAAFERWEKRRPPPPSPKSVQRLHCFKHFEGKKPTGTSGVARRRSRNASPGSSASTPVRAAEEDLRPSADHIERDSPTCESEYSDRLSIPYTRTSVSVNTGASSRGRTSLSVMLTHGQPQYVEPEPHSSTEPTSSTVAQAFRVEGFADTGQTDPYGAYAFGGPRHSPPYRYLHQIAQPHPWDISGWAENLRWAFEQRVLFEQEHSAVMGWDESPAHMACIERQRTQCVWASEELLEQLLEDD